MPKWAVMKTVKVKQEYALHCMYICAEYDSGGFFSFEIFKVLRLI